MTETEAIKKFLAGERVLVVEFLNSKADRIKWRDKESKAMMEAPLLRHAFCNANGEAAFISERVDEKFDEKSYVQKYKRGERLILTYKSMIAERGVETFSGTLEPLTK